MRDAPSLDIVSALEAAGAQIVAFDPEGMKEAARLMPSVTFAESAYDAVSGADVLVVITEWPEFRGLDPRRLMQLMRRPRIVDLRNIFNPEELRSLGFAYEGVGRRRALAPSVINKLLGNNSKISAQDPELLGSSSRVSGPA
jgi:UDPglucose 6-dehydrogenase